MRPEDYLSSHPQFGRAEARTALEREIIDYEGRVSYDEYCMRNHPNDPDWKMYRDKNYAKLKELQHQWRAEHHLLWETEAVQLELNFGD